MICKICDSTSREDFQARCLNKYTVKYFFCDNCGFLQTEEPFWLEEAYRKPINETDTGILSRNLYLSNVTATILFVLFEKNGVFLDYAGGYGILTRLMRDSGFDFYWSDPYAENIFSGGFEFDKNIKNLKGVELVTCYEAFEHFAQPIREMGKILPISSNILFSTELLPSSVPRPGDWWYYGLEHGQHISFYSARTLRHIAKRFGMNLHSDNKYVHLLTKEKISDSLFRILVRASSFGLAHLVRVFMKGKAFTDMEYLGSLKSGRDVGSSIRGRTDS